MDETTRILALVLGVYFIVAGLGVVMRRSVISEFLARFRSDPVLSFLSGVIALLVGLTILAVHWNWDNAVSAGVTVIGLIAVLKGALLILLGPRLLVLARPFDANLHLASAWGVLVCLIGAALVFAGFNAFAG